LIVYGRYHQKHVGCKSVSSINFGEVAK
jgi:hypothetical protein